MLQTEKMPTLVWINGTVEDATSNLRADDLAGLRGDGSDFASMYYGAGKLNLLPADLGDILLAMHRGASCSAIRNRS
jgi:hypothetical protein